MILAAKMNIWGNAGCRQRLAEIVDDILPRALAWIKENRPWVNALADIGQAVGAIDKTAHVRKRIEADVLAAIESSEAKPCQRKQAVSANRYEETISRDTVFDPRWKSDPAYLSLAENLLESTAIIVKSFQRHAALLRFVQSVREFYPRIPIHVADDSFENIRGTNSIADQVKQIPGVHWHAMPFDSGLPAGRNLAISQANTKYVVLCDDDFVFTAETDLSAILLPLVQCNIDLCGGLVRMDGENAQNWCGMLKFTSSPFGEKNIVMEPPSTPVENCGGIRLRRCHVTYNFFAAKRQMLLDYPYDEQFKISSEHLDSFMTWWQARKRIAFTIDCICSHSHEGAAEYKAKRNRRSFGDLLKKWGLAKRLTGGITKFPGV